MATSTFTGPVRSNAGFIGNNAGWATPGSGITSSLVTSWVTKVGVLIHSHLVVDLTGLNSNVLADVIGLNAAANCHIGQVTDAVNGAVFSGYMACLETPATGEPDIDLYSADEATLAEDTAISAATGEVALVTAAADWTSLLVAKPLIGRPIADQYLYLVGGGGTTDATYTAGIFLIELVGYEVPSV